MRKLLLIELFLCFAPIVGLFAIALVMTPFQLYSFAVAEPRHWDGLWGLLRFLFCGICGLLALVRVVSWLLRGSGEIPQPIFVSGGIVLGLVPIIDMGLSGSVGWQLLAALPLVATVHTLVLCRASLFRWLRHHDRSA